MKIIIVGGGWAGLSLCHLLCEHKELEILLIEKEKELGGQSSSAFGKDCYDEYCWRVFFPAYNNIKSIIKDIGIKNNFEHLHSALMVQDEYEIDVKDLDDASYLTIGNKIKLSYTAIAKMFYLASLSEDYIYKNYSNVLALEYFDNNEFIKYFLGPYMGFEPSKVSVAGVYSQLKKRVNVGSLNLNFKQFFMTGKPPNEAIFLNWEKYLKQKGVTIYKNTPVQKLLYENGEIKGIQIKNKSIKSDIVVLCSSLLPTIDLLKPLHCKKTIQKLEKAKKGLQYYFSTNLFFKEPLYNQKGKGDYSFSLIDKPWQPMITTRNEKGWKKLINKNCNAKIKELWNVAVFDGYKGELYKKKLSDCTIKEVEEEIIYECKTAPFIKNLRTKSGKTFDEVLLGWETHYFWKNKNGKIYTEHPKFSLNVGIDKNLIPFQSKDIPKNIYIAAYYNEWAGKNGVSMETSATIGLLCGEKILNDRNIKNKRKIYT